MSIKTYAEINTGGVVVNLVQWDGVTTYNVAPNTLHDATGQPNAQIGGTFAGGVFTAPAVGAAVQGIMDVVANPANNSTHQIPDPPQPQNEIYCVIEPSAAGGNISIVLPQDPSDGAYVVILSTKAIAALTAVIPSGQGNLNLPTAAFALAASTPVHAKYSAQFSSWFTI